MTVMRAADTNHINTDLGWVALNSNAAPIKGDHGYDPEVRSFHWL
jgi:hypothetical protein